MKTTDPKSLNLNSDLTFFTNEDGATLLNRFQKTLANTRFFDCLVGYFYTSGFYELYQSLENTKKIRILIGLKTDRQTFDLINRAKQQEFDFSHAEAKAKFSDQLADEMEAIEEGKKIEKGICKFKEWIESDKLEIKAYPSANIHAKVYVMSFAEEDRDVGRVITGSSNFSRSGLVDNLEFNVELKNAADYHFALDKFNELWANAVDVSEKYVETLDKRTWLNNNISPYELYLKFLYEYFYDDINKPVKATYKYIPAEYKQLEYQDQAVLNAKKILLAYGGVFISDVVGLGKTYISAQLAQQLDGRNLVLAPPVLLDKENPGSWTNVFSDFHVAADFESIGSLDKLIRRGMDKYKNVFIDEAHRFRTESNVTYEKLARICRGKRVILVTATPLNNSPKDILSQIKLFQKAKNSTIPGLRNLEAFFNSLEKKLKGLDRRNDYERYIETVRGNAKEIRAKVLSHLMVRRTRKEIEKHYGEDLKKQGFKFPEVEAPSPALYELNDNEDDVFNQTIKLITKDFKYSRYMPLLPEYYKGDISGQEVQGQRNMARFMKILLVKRLESSFFAFKNTLERFIQTYEQVLNEFSKGKVYISKKYAAKIFEFLANDDDEAIQCLLTADKAQAYSSREFTPRFKADLENDLKIIKEIHRLWSSITRDPKLLKFIDILKKDKILKESKLIIFSESRETIEYLYKNLNTLYPDEVIAYTGKSGASTREKVIDNFDANVRFPKDDYRILLTTEILAEGVNLHRSNVVINYDIPWNPTRLRQRVGRVNRVDTKFDKIYTYNFFPTKQSNEQIKLKEAAEYKIQAFIEMLGADAKLLTDGEEIKSHELYECLISKASIEDEGEGEESELDYLQIIRDVRDNNEDLFAKIKHLPKKARSAKLYDDNSNATLTYFRKGKLQKFYLADKDGAKEIDFFTAAKLFMADKSTKKEKINSDAFYQYLEDNKQEFIFDTSEEVVEISTKGGGGNAARVLKILRAREIRTYKGYTDEDERYIKDVVGLIAEGALPKQTLKVLAQELKKELNNGVNPLKFLTVLRLNIAPEFFKATVAESAAQTSGPREIILSEYLV